MRRSLVKPTAINSRINLSPIIDVSLVLVIILLITAPMMTQADIDVSLPQAQTRGAEDEKRITITLGKEGELAIDETIIAPESLPALLHSQLADRSEDMLVIIRADESTPHQAVRKVLSQASAAGARRIAIATRQKVRGSL